MENCKFALSCALVEVSDVSAFWSTMRGISGAKSLSHGLGWPLVAHCPRCHNHYVVCKVSGSFTTLPRAATKQNRGRGIFASRRRLFPRNGGIRRGMSSSEVMKSPQRTLYGSPVPLHGVELTVLSKVAISDAKPTRALTFRRRLTSPPA
jgi:hypothetical protein